MPSSSVASRPVWAIMAVLFVAEVVASLEGSMLFTALPTIAREYGLSSSAWLITGYVLVSGASAVLGSRLGDMFGRKRALITVLLICTIGSLLSALTHDLRLTVLGRMLQGSTGAILPLSFGIARALVPKHRAPLCIGILSGAYAGSSALGYVVGGVFAEHGDWRHLFWLTASLPVVISAAAAWIVPKDEGSARGARVDWWGAVLLIAAIMLIQLGVGQVRHGQVSAVALAEILGGVALLALWVLVELRMPSPLVDIRQLLDRKIALANLTNVFLGLGAMQLALVLMMLIQQPVATGIGFGVGATLAGIIKLPSNLVSLITGPFSGLMAGRNGAKLPIVIGGAVMAFGWYALALLHHELWHVVAGTLIGAVGSSLIMASVPNLVIEVAPEKDTSTATGLTLVVRGVATSIGTQVVATLLAAPPGGAPDEQGYVSAMVFIGTMSLLTLVVALFIPRRPGAPGSAGAASPHGLQPSKPSTI